MTRRYKVVATDRIATIRKLAWELYYEREVQRRGLTFGDPLDVRKLTGERVRNTTSCGVFLRDPSTGDALLRVDDADEEVLALDGLSKVVDGKRETFDLSNAVETTQLTRTWRDRLSDGSLEPVEDELTDGR